MMGPYPPRPRQPPPMPRTAEAERLLIQDLRRWQTYTASDARIGRKIGDFDRDQLTELLGRAVSRIGQQTGTIHSLKAKLFFHEAERRPRGGRVRQFLWWWLWGPAPPPFDRPGEFVDVPIDNRFTVLETPMTINVGDRVRDRISGYEGIAICRNEWLYGCVRILVQAEALGTDGKPVPEICVDEQSLELIEHTDLALAAHNEPPGGIRPDPQRAPDPLRR